jgi:hypothetical protein
MASEAGCNNSSRESVILHRAFTKSASIFVLLFIAALTARAGDWQYEGVSRVVAIADIHGAYDAMVEALLAADVVDADLAWSAGDAHLVIVGDILDRGPDSRPAMDLLIRLETEAAANGGNVHVLIGNHEAMNLVGDLRYVSTSEYAAFADDERPEERERWFAEYTQKRASGDQSAEALNTIFRQKFPPGFFAHRREFASDGKYGKWLLSKPAIVVVNGTAFVHGGLSPMVAKIGLEGVNGKLIGEMAEYIKQLEFLYETGVLLPTDAFYDHPSIVGRYMPPLNSSVEVLRAIDAIKTLNDSNLYSLDGPLWYRGNIVCSELIEVDKLASALEAIGANRVVIGHTPTPGRRVLERLNGQIIQIDTGMLNNYYGGSANVLIIDEAGVSVVNQDSEVVAVPAPHPRKVGSRPQGNLSYEQLESLLTEGEVVGRKKDDAGRDIVTVSDGTSTIESVFERRKGRGFYPEVAAYRLDKLINLDMVPVAVVRTVEGREGSLQFLPKNWIDEFKRQQDGSGGSAWCDIKEQWNAMFVFDVLTHNNGRNGRNILYSLDLWQLMLVGHQDAFSTRKGLPERLKSVPFEVGQGWKDAATGLNEATLTEALGDVLDEKRLRALAARATAIAGQ